MPNGKRRTDANRAGGPFLLSCDWGTSTFRLRLVRRSDAKVMDEVRSESGAADLARNQNSRTRRQAYERVMGHQVSTLARRNHLKPEYVPIIISGMAGSSVGWKELPYAQLPFPLDGRKAKYTSVRFPLRTGHGNAVIISGLRGGAEVMRGEEVELIGLFSQLAYQPLARRSIVVLPGTHSKHVEVRQNAVHAFRTYMTGELYTVLATHSLLRHSVDLHASTGPLRGRDALAFDAGVECARQITLSEALFRVRTNALFQRFPPKANARFLSGLLIGTEAADLARRSRGIPVILCAPERVGLLYRRAFEAFGLRSRLHVVDASDVSHLSVYGHLALARRWDGYHKV